MCESLPRCCEVWGELVACEVVCRRWSDGVVMSAFFLLLSPSLQWMKNNKSQEEEHREERHHAKEGAGRWGCGNTASNCGEQHSPGGRYVKSIPGVTKCEVETSSYSSKLKQAAQCITKKGGDRGIEDSCQYQQEEGPINREVSIHERKSEFGPDNDHPGIRAATIFGRGHVDCSPADGSLAVPSASDSGVLRSAGEAPHSLGLLFALNSTDFHALNSLPNRNGTRDWCSGGAADQAALANESARGPRGNSNGVDPANFGCTNRERYGAEGKNGTGRERREDGRRLHANNGSTPSLAGND